MSEDPFHDMNPELVRRIQAFINASEGRIRPGSGFRTYQEQARLYANYKAGVAGQARAAPPGRSNHNHGLAMDLQYSRDGAQWAAQNAARFGLHFPVPGENWHVEMIDDDGSRAAMRTAQAGGGLGFESIDTARDPEDELTHRLDSIMSIIGGGNVARKVAGTPEPALRTETIAPDATAQMAQQPAKGGQMAGKGVDRWRPFVEQALRIVGEPVNEQNIAITLRRMKQESGGDPAIVNNWDVNAKRGTPSIGLMQVIKPTFDKYAGEFQARGQTDPLANLVASMRYAKARYGSLAAAYNKTGGY